MPFQPSDLAWWAWLLCGLGAICGLIGIVRFIKWMDLGRLRSRRKCPIAAH
jgi:H+/Cl- antiporter ClcA